MDEVYQGQAVLEKEANIFEEVAEGTGRKAREDAPSI